MSNLLRKRCQKILKRSDHVMKKCAPSFKDPWVWSPLLIFAVLICIIHLTGFNTQLFLFFNKTHTITGDRFLAILTLFGDGLVAAVLLFPFLKKRPDIIWSVLIASVIYMIILHSLKRILDLPRPAGVLENDTFHIIGRRLTKHAFPSGHTTTIVTLMGVIAFTVRKNVIYIFGLLFGLIVGFSRIAVGVHWPMDVCGGVILGWLSAWLGVVIAKKTKWGYSRPVQIIFCIILLVCTIDLLFWYNTHYPLAEPAKWAIGLVCLVWGSIEFYKVVFKK
ncbi:MAG TPA: phosphatase PAP2 family protein [Candidatus Cloacimonetes bacterium]|nr:phosphatase PAP2 family protein [Candidatus Cloacimonadota bacterium]HEX37541.1 phosphatase PAP2 family protein [Candidatus Cloacimonadota bacterium]